jgi:oleate hydratase
VSRRSPKRCDYAAGLVDFGKRAVFNGNVAESKWLSFTDSNWLRSVVLPYQPRFINQPADVYVFWDYGRLMLGG